MIRYFKESFRRKKARRVTQEFAPVMEKFQLAKDGAIDFANWDNPLVPRYEITQSYVDFFRKFINEGDLIVDIGANIGDTTVPMAIAAGKQGTTLGFDPNPFVYKILQVNAGLNSDQTNIIPVLRAISKAPSEFYYISSEASYSNGAISPTRDTKHGKFVYPEKIKGVNLLSYLKDEFPEKLDRLSFIKIDTEGYDKEIIKSIGDLIEQYKPTIIAESFYGNTDEEKKELFKVIAQHGYDIHYFEDFKMEAPTKKLERPEDLLPWDKTINIYCTPR